MEEIFLLCLEIMLPFLSFNDKKTLLWFDSAKPFLFIVGLVQWTICFCKSIQGYSFDSMTFSEPYPVPFVNLRL